MPKERILITVKTYPTLSRSYGETVCTAGVREDGSWVRIFPVPFRRLDREERYKKFDWIECDLAANTKDPRPESMRPVDVHQLYGVDHIGTEDSWRERRKIILEKCCVYDRLDEVIAAAKANERSLAVFKPSKILDLKVESEDREWSAEKLAEMRSRSNYRELFEEDSWRETFQVIPKLPYSFSYRFEDATGKESTLQILDWEIGALYWNSMKRHGDEKVAIEKVRQQYIDQFTAKDLHFFLGTTQSFHFVGPNPWVIIGVFYPPVVLQRELF